MLAAKPQRWATLGEKRSEEGTLEQIEKPVELYMMDLRLYGIEKRQLENDPDKIAEQIGKLNGGGFGNYRILLDLAKDIEGEGFCMEIGVLYGPGVCSMAAGAKLGGKGKVIALDHINRDEILNSDDFFTRHNFLRYGPGQLFQLFYNAFLLDVADHIIFITEDSMIAHQWLNVPLRLLHIDANHDYDHVKNDIRFYGDMIIPGGYICCGNSLENGCRHAVEEFVRDSGKYEDFHRPIDGFAVARKI